jgi:hypothetical protein
MRNAGLVVTIQPVETAPVLRELLGALTRDRPRRPRREEAVRRNRRVAPSNAVDPESAIIQDIWGKGYATASSVVSSSGYPPALMAISIPNRWHHRPDATADAVDQPDDPAGGEIYRGNLAGIRKRHVELRSIRRRGARAWSAGQLNLANQVLVP